MSNAMRGKHSKNDHISTKEMSNGLIRLTCTDGWTYDADQAFVDAVIERHKHEAFLP